MAANLILPINNDKLDQEKQFKERKVILRGKNNLLGGGTLKTELNSLL